MAKTIQPSPKVLAARRNGALGGKARAAKHSKEAIQSWGAKGGRSTQDKYGSDLKVFMSNRRQYVGCKSKPVAETMLGKKKHATKVRRKKEHNLKEAA